MSQKSETNQVKSTKRVSPELAEVLHMLKSLEQNVSDKSAVASR